MKCPSCNTDLLSADRQGVEIDFCPQCRGVWLDRDELDKIIERSITAEKKWHEQDDDSDDDRRKHEHGVKHKKRIKSFLGDLFDIG